jgi:hypothetical protein
LHESIASESDNAHHYTWNSENQRQKYEIRYRAFEALTIHTLPEEQRNITIVFIRRKDGVTTKALEAFLKIIREKTGQ